MAGGISRTCTCWSSCLQRSGCQSYQSSGCCCWICCPGWSCDHSGECWPPGARSGQPGPARGQPPGLAAGSVRFHWQANLYRLMQRGRPAVHPQPQLQAQTIPRRWQAREESAKMPTCHCLWGALQPSPPASGWAPRSASPAQPPSGPGWRCGAGCPPQETGCPSRS